MNKVTYKGKQYTIGGLYEFRGIGEAWYVRRLRGINKDSAAPFIDEKCSDWSCIREMQNPIIGTIKDAPIKLEDGAVYQFDINWRTTVGIYHADDNGFSSPSGFVVKPECANIVKLVPEKK